MALLKAQEVRQMSADDRQKRLTELRGQLMNERGIAAMGGSPPSPGKIRQIRTAIARILTIQNQERAGKVQWATGETPKASAPATKKAVKKEPKTGPTSQQGRVDQERFRAKHAASHAKMMAGKKAAPKKLASQPKKSDAKKPATAKAAPAKKHTKKEE